MDSVRSRQKGVAAIFDYSSFSGSLVVNNLRCTLGIERTAVINVTDPMHVPEFEQWADVYADYDTAISAFVKAGYWPVLLAPATDYSQVRRPVVSYLTDYRHPDKAVYITGPDSPSDDDKIYERLIEVCNDVITVPSDDRDLYAVTALTVALWDRHIKADSNLREYIMATLH